jgi:hypothetical protein
MKKVVFLFAAVLIMFSGVAAVSATEGHLVDIKAHVENAIGVETYDLDFGNVFPEEYVERTLTLGLSNSFSAETRVDRLSYFLYWELKPIGESGAEPAYLGDYYQPLNPFLTVTALDQGTEPTGCGYYWGPNSVDTIPGVGAAVKFGDGILKRGVDECDELSFLLMAPAFGGPDGWYNEITDPNDEPGILQPEQYVIEKEEICGKLMDVPHADLGINLKIQLFYIRTAENVTTTNPP